MKISVNLAELKIYDPALYRDLVQMLKDQGLDIANMGTMFIDDDAGYHRDVMQRLQASAVEGLRLAEEHRRKQEEPQITEQDLQDMLKPEPPQPPRTFADKLKQYS